MEPFSLFVVAAMLVFNLYLMVRQQYVQRPMFIVVGLAAVGLAVIGSFFQTWPMDTWARVLVGMFSMFAAIISLAAAPMAVCKCSKGTCQPCQPGQDQPRPPMM